MEFTTKGSGWAEWATSISFTVNSGRFALVGDFAWDDDLILHTDPEEIVGRGLCEACQVRVPVEVKTT